VGYATCSVQSGRQRGNVTAEGIRLGGCELRDGQGRKRGEKSNVRSGLKKPHSCLDPEREEGKRGKGAKQGRRHRFQRKEKNGRSPIRR